MADFQDAMVFVNDIENSKYMLKVNSLSFSLKQKEEATDDPRAKPGLVMSLDISSVRLMEK